MDKAALKMLPKPLLSSWYIVEQVGTHVVWQIRMPLWLAEKHGFSYVLVEQ